MKIIICIISRATSEERGRREEREGEGKRERGKGRERGAKEEREEEGKREGEREGGNKERKERERNHFLVIFYFSNRFVSYTIISKTFLAVINIYALMLKSICQ